MVGFPDLSDTDESAIDEIISQAQDACVLEQVSAINCASFTDSVLPTDLESRFRKLKSFPVTKAKQNPKTSNYSAKGKAGSTFVSNEQTPQFSPFKEGKMGLDGELRSGPMSDSSDIWTADKVEFSPEKESSCRKEEVKAKSKRGSVSSPSDSSNSSEESSISSLFQQKLYGKKCSKQKSKGEFQSSPRSSTNSLMDRSPSPPRKAGCFWCYPKKDSRKKSKENWDSVANILGWDKNDEFLSDIGSLSSKHQQKMLKKAIKEEQKINREAEKIVQWAKQASARMSASAIEDDLSDD
ncbi:uncharacterized protein LOC129311498 [Prosopis cineraria]|uniref:uncharacterized protein LOC129311498 n=1 Tax=Prosopis cineraria TaxID=364024 RepID=UPI0024102BC6|nr:uncharacterized protein LOC129311498 [Prosopis cineraria]XP_054809804.1 uncharacterized protein LOC129311498 [Prosopis cineraria]